MTNARRYSDGAIIATAEHRARYSTEVEPAPSRFTGGTEYAEWAMRADAWVPEESFWTCPTCGKESEDGLAESHFCWGAIK